MPSLHSVLASVAVAAVLPSLASAALRGAAQGPVDTGGPSFVSIGDWGGAALKDYHQTDELAVAKQLATTAAQLDAKFLLNVGDNFYYYGIWNTSDPQIDTDFEKVYTADSLMIKWYSVLGNHDYGFNPDAQLQYKSPNKDRWVMPARYYTKRLLIGGSQYASIIFLDSNPCVSAYRADDPSGWDPCGSSYPSPADCQFHANILKENCGDQYNWLKSTIATIPADDWKFIVTHHVADEIDVNDLVSLTQQLGADLFLNGHSHELEYYTIDNAGAYITTGAGCMVKISGEGEAEEDVHPKLASNGHSFQSKWFKKVAGFTTHTFSSDLQSLTTNFVDYTGATLYSFTIQRGKGPKPSPPTPGSQTCKAYGCGSYDKSHPCQCNSECSKYNDCCSDYATTCG